MPPTRLTTNPRPPGRLLEEAGHMPRRKPKVLDRKRAKMSPAAAATLRFANTGIFQLAAHPPIDSAGIEPLEWVRQYVHAQLTAVVSGNVADLDRVDCAACSQLHEYARRRFESLRQHPRTGGRAAAPTEEESVAVAVDVVRSTTTIGVRELIPSRRQLRRCQRAECAQWFVAPDVRRAFCSERCQKVERPAARAYTRPPRHRQIPQVKARA